MAGVVYYKFKSARDYSSILFQGNFISVANLKTQISESKRLARGNALILANAQSNEEYLDGSMLIPKHTSIIVRRVPILQTMPIVAEQDKQKFIEDKVKEASQASSSIDAAQSSVMKSPEKLELDDFGDDVYAAPKVLSVEPRNPVVDSPSLSEIDEDSRIKALVSTPALDWQRQTQKGFCSGKGLGRGTGGRMMGGLGYGWAGLEQMTPPQGYVCHRCNIPGHFIQHCPTNGDPNYDFKRVKPTAHLISVLNEATFEKEIEGMRSTQSVTNLPPELHCPMCKEVMIDAVITSKCCFMSFCDKCIRNRFISNSMCFCGATNVLADDLLPNVTLRETINSITENSSSIVIQGTDSACNEQSKVSSVTISLASNGEKISSPDNKETINVEKDVANAPQPSLDKDNVQKELASNEPGKKKKKKTCLPVNGMDKQWRTPQEIVAGNSTLPLCPSAYNPYTANIPLGMHGHMAYYSGVTSHWGYAPAYYNVPVGGPLPQDSFVGQWDLLSHQRKCSSKQDYDQSLKSQLVVAEHSHHNDHQFHQAESLSMEQSLHTVEAGQIHKRLYQYQNQDHQHIEAAADRIRKGSELSSTTFPGQDINKKRKLPPIEAGNPNKKKQLLCSTDGTNCKYGYREPTSTHFRSEQDTSVSSGQRECRITLDHDWTDDDDDDDRNFKRKPSWYRSSLTFQERAIPV